jgi:hypothetical protein
MDFVYCDVLGSFFYCHKSVLKVLIAGYEQNYVGLPTYSIQLTVIRMTFFPKKSWSLKVNLFLRLFKNTFLRLFKNWNKTLLEF